MADASATEPYRVYTRDYDLELRWEKVAETLPTASPDASRGWLGKEAGLFRRSLRQLETLLQEQQGAKEEALLDELGAGLGRSPPAEIIDALLVDQSGSMKGRPMAHAAAAAAQLSRLLAGLSIGHEVLGFTTAGWHGGFAYRQWRDCGSPSRPGRLCGLMHVIYKSADGASLRPEALQTMLNPDLLRENVDGEALERASGRLLQRPERHKLLIVISDGAPVDDATLLHNGAAYLERHLLRTIARLEALQCLLLGAIGVNHRVDRYYGLSESVQNEAQAPSAAVALLKKLLGRLGIPRTSPP